MAPCQYIEPQAGDDSWHRPLTASALVASIGNARNFANGRQLAAWLGLVPRQHSTGGKSNLLGISKRGDCYLRTLLIHGTRSVIRYAEGKPCAQAGWLQKLIGRRNKNVATVALANKNARIVWALLAHDREFRQDYAVASSYRPGKATQAATLNNRKLISPIAQAIKK